MVAEVWGLYDQTIGLNQVREFGGVLCFAAKWYGEAPVYFHSEWGDGLEQMLEAMHPPAYSPASPSLSLL